jgi:hypothetical protein
MSERAHKQFKEFGVAGRMFAWALSIATTAILVVVFLYSTFQLKSDAQASKLEEEKKDIDLVKKLDSMDSDNKAQFGVIRQDLKEMYQILLDGR